MMDLPSHQNIFDEDLRTVEEYSRRLNILLERMERLEESLRSLPLPNNIIDICANMEKVQVDEIQDGMKEGLKEESIAETKLEEKERKEDKQEIKENEMENSTDDS